MRVLLLGASGLLGHHVLHLLMERGCAVRVLVRRASAVQMPDGGWETMVGELTDAATLRHAAEGCDAIVNCAGTTDMSLLRREDYRPVNSTLCATIVETMEQLGIKTLVHTSTVNTIGYGSAGHPAGEEAPMRPPFAGSYYADSKCEGEMCVLEAARRHADWHAVVVNPGYMLGPWDVKPSSGRMLLLGYRRRWMAAPRGGKAFVDVRDVAAAVVAALTRGRNGGRYIAVNSDACLSVKELYEMQARVMGYRQRVLTLPVWLTAVAGRVGDVLRTVGVRTELSTRNVRQLAVREYYSSRLAVDELDMPQSPVSDAIRDFHRWRQEREKREV